MPLVRDALHTPRQFMEIRNEIVMMLDQAAEVSGLAAIVGQHELHYEIYRNFLDETSAYFASAHLEFLASNATYRESLENILGHLTTRQDLILALCLDHKSNKAIAKEIFTSEATVHHELTRIYKAFGVVGRDALFKFHDAERERERERDS